MDTVKKPEVLLTIGNTVAIVGIAVYFYKQIAAIKTELSELTEHLKTSVKKFSNVQADTVPLETVKELLTKFNARIEQTEARLSKLGDGEELELLEDALETLSDILVNNGVEWSYPPKRTRGRRGGRRGERRRGRKRSGRRASRYSDSDSDSEDEEDSDSDVESSIAKVRSKKAKSRRR